MTFKCCIATAILFFLFQTRIDAQQNHSMYLQHYLPESNLLNPAVPLECKWYVGIPALSSIHVNFAHSGASVNQMFLKSEEGNYSIDTDKITKGLFNRNYLGSEVHLQWLALGYRRKNYSFFFTLTEKNNIPFTYPKSSISILWDGNSAFEGREVSLKGTGLFFNHYREYAFTALKGERTGTIYGLRAKLLFGKLNIAPRSFNVDLMTDEVTFNLNFMGDINVNTSLPLTVSEINGMVNVIQLDDDIDPIQLMLNRKNPGFAIDAGVIYPYSKKLELSASVIDLGFIRWRSNLNNFKGEGNFFYDGALDETDDVESYIHDISESVVDSFEIQVSRNKYTTVLPPRFLAGAKYTVSNSFNIGVNSDVLVYHTKILPSLTLSGQLRPIENLHLIGTYTFQYSSFNNIGFGLVFGRNPMQVYAISDNITGFFWPLDSRNINLRFGLNIIFGCNANELKSSSRGSLYGNCSCYEGYSKPKRKR